MRRSAVAIPAAALATLALAASAHAAPGDLDPSFDRDGIVLTHAGAAPDLLSQAQAVLVQPDGKIVAGGASTEGDFALVRYNPDGSLDGMFGTGGIATVDLGGLDLVHDVVLQPDGKIVAVGVSDTATDQDFVLARFDSNGSPDMTFDGNAVQGTEFGGNEHAMAVALQPDGKIVAAGYSDVGGSARFAVARYNPDGTHDDSFDDDGRLLTDSTSVGSDVVLQPDGKIVVAGGLWLARYNPDGSLDETFRNGGIAPAAAVATSVALQPDGKFVVAGYQIQGQWDFALGRHNPDGSADRTFGDNGRVVTDFGADEMARDVVLEPDGRILAAGSEAPAANGQDDFHLARYLPNGSLDPAFGIGGKVKTDLGTDEDHGHAAALQPDGKIVVAGRSLLDFGLARYEGGPGVGGGGTGGGGDGGAGGSGGSGGGVGGARDTVPPNCAVERAKARNPLTFELTCDEASFVALAGAVVAKRKPERAARLPSAARRLEVPLRPAGAPIPFGETETLKLKPRGKKKKAKRKLKKLRRAVRAGAKAQAKLELTSVDAAGNLGNTSIKVKIGR